MASRHQTSYVDVQRASRAPILVSLFATVEHCYFTRMARNHRTIRRRRHLSCRVTSLRKTDCETMPRSIRFGTKRKRKRTRRYKQGAQRSYVKPEDYIVISEQDVKHLPSHIPSFRAGDGVFFDEYIIHSTEFRRDLNGLMRHAIETWFHPRCSASNPYSHCLLWEPHT